MISPNIIFFIFIILVISLIIFCYSVCNRGSSDFGEIQVATPTAPNINSSNDVCYSDKILDLKLGQPEFFRPFIQSDFLGSNQKVREVGHLYVLENGDSITDKEPIEIKSNLIKLHKKYPTCTISKDPILGNGTTQVLAAFFWAVKSYVHYEKPIYVFYQKPGADFLYKAIARTVGVTVIDNIDDFEGDSDQLVEIITSPNNPNGAIQESVTNAKWKIYDMVYAWPHLMSQRDWKNLLLNPIEDNCLFSASKLFGLAGSRIGWGFIKDKCLVKYMKEFIFGSTINWSRDGMNRVNVALKKILNENIAKKYFSTLREEVVERHNELSKKIKLLNTPGAYAWVKKNPDEFKKLDILVEPGEAFGVSNNFSRLNLMASKIKFDELLKRLSNKNGY